MNPIEDTPAAKAGLLAGDLITRLDDKPVRGMTLDQAVRKMRGEPGTKITLTIYRKSEERTFPVTITRAEIKVQSVKTKLLENNLLWVRITSFQERTVPDLAKKMANPFEAFSAMAKGTEAAYDKSKELMENNIKYHKAFVAYQEAMRDMMDAVAANAKILSEDK